jgi:excisionase family DNA binding protein
VTVANEASSTTAIVLQLDGRGRAALSPAEACETLVICMSNLYGLMKDGKIPFFHIGGRTKLMVADVARFLESQRNENPGMRQVPWDRNGLGPRQYHPRREDLERVAKVAKPQLRPVGRPRKATRAKA